MYSNQALAINALEIVQNQLILQISERNKHLKYCLESDDCEDEEGKHELSISYDDGDDLSCSKCLVAASNAGQTCGLQGLVSALHKYKMIPHINLLELENKYLIERIWHRNLKLQFIHLQQRTNRTMQELEADPLVANMRYSDLMSISESLLEIGTDEEKKNYMLQWNDSLRQVIKDIDKVECDGFQWVNFDLYAKLLELQVKLHSYETLSEGTRKTISLPLIEMENRYLSEAAYRRIVFLKVKWLKEHAQDT